MNPDQLTSFNRVFMFIWLGCGILALLITAYTFFTGGEEYTMWLTVALLAFLMYGWKKFQLAKFGTRNTP